MAINGSDFDYPHTDKETGAPIILSEPTKEPKKDVVKLVKNSTGGIQINHNISQVNSRYHSLLQ